jgi:hypothetical protein
MSNEILDQNTSSNAIVTKQRWKFNKRLILLSLFIGIPSTIITYLYTPDQFSEIIHLSLLQTTGIVIGLIFIAIVLMAIAIIRIIRDIRQNKKS